jgi:hypothetical protein
MPEEGFMALPELPCVIIRRDLMHPEQRLLLKVKMRIAKEAL